jgi:oligopeptide transport system ATP-binding protein
MEITPDIPVVAAQDLRVYFTGEALFAKPRWVAGPLSLTIWANEFVGLAGPSGSGKTSLGKALLNLIPTWEGKVFWQGEDVRRRSLRRRRGQFGWICQEPTLAFNPRFRIREVLDETLAVNRCRNSHQIFELCEMLQLDVSLLNRYPFELSGGQVQRFALLRVLLLQPRFVVLDEPASSLDPLNQRLLIDRLFAWRERHGLTALFIAHSRRLLEQVTSRVITLGEEV